MNRHDLIIIGAGPGGYVAAIRAAQLGLNVGCIESEEALGGTCLRVGCIPSKALLESTERLVQARDDAARYGVIVKEVSADLGKMLARKNEVVGTLTKGVASLFKKHKIKRYRGHGRIAGPGRVDVVSGTDTTALEAANILIATGSRVAPLRGVELDGDRIGSSTEAISYSEIPRHLIVIGAGYIGLELGSVWRRLGALVTVLEYLDRILPGMDAEIAADAQKVFAKQGIDFLLGSRVTAAHVEGDGCVVEYEQNGEAATIKGDRVLVAVGRVPNTDDLGLDTAGITLDDGGRVTVDDHFATSCPGIFAIGDVIRGPMLAHKAEEEGTACVERIVTGYGHVNYAAIPGIVYTHPEIATVGRAEQDLQAEGVKYRKGVFPFLANGRARCIGETEGKVKILADSVTDRVLGVHIIGPRAGDLIAEAAVSIEFGASSEDIARSAHAHPTLAEALKEAALAVDARPIHI